MTSSKHFSTYKLSQNLNFCWGIFSGFLLLASTILTADSATSFPNNFGTKIGQLPNGEYRFCSRPPAEVESPLTVNGWCFLFQKWDRQIVGIYAFSAPYGDAQLCISGITTGSLLIGNALELWSHWDSPITSSDLIKNDERVWSENKNKPVLRIKNGRIVDSGRSQTGFFAWISYQVSLDLTEFYRHKIRTKKPPRSCINEG